MESGEGESAAEARGRELAECAQGELWDAALSRLSLHLWQHEFSNPAERARRAGGSRSELSLRLGS